MSDFLLDDQILAAFAEALAVHAPEVRAQLGAGRSEDEIRTRCATVGLEPSADAVTWWSFWDGPPPADASGWTDEQRKEHTRGVHQEILPGFQTVSLDACIRGTAWWRDFAEQGSFARTGYEADALWPRTWILMFGDGGGGHKVLDCSLPDEPSALRDCFRENFSGPNWGKLIRPIGPWLANATDWMRLGTCRYDAESRTWQPHEAASAYWPLFDPNANYDAWR